MAVMTEMTIRAPMSNIPTIRMDKDTVTAARTTSMRLNLPAFMPLTSAISLSKATAKSSL